MYLTFYHRSLSFFSTAFSFFSLCEYIIAYTNIGYHATAYIDFKENDWMVGIPSHEASNGSVVDNNNFRPTTAAMVITANGTSSRRRKQ